MPPRLPIHTTSQPAARISSATASPGKMWPPVPPAMMRIVFTRGPGTHSCVETSGELAVFPVDAKQDRERDEVHHQARAAVAHERQREPLGRQQAHVDAHVDERLEADPDADALRGERGE